MMDSFRVHCPKTAVTSSIESDIFPTRLISPASDFELPEVACHPSQGPPLFDRLALPGYHVSGTL